MALTAVPGPLSRPARPELLLEWLADTMLLDDPVSQYVAGLDDRELASLDIDLIRALVAFSQARVRIQTTLNRQLRDLTAPARSEDG